ncbi:hypothetical protein ACGFYV_29825 [Streptomyces sp. NPDC048297]|uniref:hypothetical protein n=1 Tax=Streptomyces sp. NPDC048297 TaxID=3365531 RepID=UPI003717D3A7
MPGTVLLLAASPLGKGRLVDAAGVLPVLAAVAPAVLSGTDTANVVELADPLDPQAVLTRLRAAAAAPGPLTLYVAGQLHLDRRQRLPHLALARTTPATMRYTALPWHWIREELRLRSAADTALVADLHADAETWRYLAERPLESGPNVSVYGRIAPGAGGRRIAEPSYMKAVATLLRSGHRPPLPRLHEQALTRIAEGGAGRDMILGGFAGSAPTAPYGHGHPAPHTTTDIPPHTTTDIPPHTTTDIPPRIPAHVGQLPEHAGQLSAHVGQLSGHVSPLDGNVGPLSGQRGQRGPVRPQAADTSAAVDPHAAISDAVRTGRYGDADALAARYEDAAAREHGPVSDEALHWAEVRADLAMFAGDAVRSCRSWMDVAGVRLAAGQPGDAPAVEAAVDRAHHQWGSVEDVAQARELGFALADLRLRVPGRREGALENVQRHLRELQAQ